MTLESAEALNWGISIRTTFNLLSSNVDRILRTPYSRDIWDDPTLPINDILVRGFGVTNMEEVSEDEKKDLLVLFTYLSKRVLTYTYRFNDKSVFQNEKNWNRTFEDFLTTIDRWDKWLLYHDISHAAVRYIVNPTNRGNHIHKFKPTPFKQRNRGIVDSEDSLREEFMALLFMPSGLSEAMPLPKYIWNKLSDEDKGIMKSRDNALPFYKKYVWEIVERAFQFRNPTTINNETSEDAGL